MQAQIEKRFLQSKNKFDYRRDDFQDTGSTDRSHEKKSDSIGLDR